MMFETLAIRITEDTLSLAVACVPELATRPFRVIENQALILNVPYIHWPSEEVSAVSFQNRWLPWQQFAVEYDVSDKEDDSEFMRLTEVYKVRDCVIDVDHEGKYLVDEQVASNQAAFIEYYGQPGRRSFVGSYRRPRQGRI